MDEKKLEKLLSIEDREHTPAERTSMIIQGVNWLTLMQSILILFIHHVPNALMGMLQTLLKTNKESK